MIIARAHIIISAWIIHAARLCERRVRASRPKLKSGSYIARSIKMSINPRRYRCLLLLLTLSLQLTSPPQSVVWFIFFFYSFSPGASFAGDDTARPVPGKRLVDLNLVEDTPRSSTPVVSHRDTRFSTIRHFSLFLMLTLRLKLRFIRT